MSSPLDHSEFEAVLKARQELGPEMEPALVESFAAKVVAEIRRQQGSEFHSHSLTPAKRAGEKRVSRKSDSYNPMTLAIVSLVMAIPLTAIALNLGGWFMGIMAWVGIVLVNLAAAYGAAQKRD